LVHVEWHYADKQLNAALRRLVEMYAKEADGVRAFYARVHSDPALVVSCSVCSPLSVIVAEIDE
jgi:hypothetical protein